MKHGNSAIIKCNKKEKYNKTHKNHKENNEKL